MERIGEEMVVAYFRALSHYLRGGAEENRRTFGSKCESGAMSLWQPVNLVLRVASAGPGVESIKNNATFDCAEQKREKGDTV